MFKGTKIRHIVKKSLIRVGFGSTPNFLIIGAQKAGTTFLYSLLRQHPSIVEPVNKEAHFFDYDKNYNQGLFKYKLNFDLSFRFGEGQQTFESTPDYLPHRLAPSRLSKHFPELKLIVLLREPISRALSAWKMHHHTFKNHPKYNWLYDPRDLETVIESALTNKMNDFDLMNHFGRSKYGHQLEEWHKYFPKHQFYITTQNKLRNETNRTLSEICNFLHLKEFSIDDIDSKDSRFWTNTSIIEDISISPETREKLQQYYKADHELLENILNIKITW